MNSATEEMRMDAYYYGFESTGIAEVDCILSAVACAGKAFHHTEDWRSECPAYHGGYLTGNTPIEWIQNAAISAAARIAELEAALSSHPHQRRAYPQTPAIPEARPVPELYLATYHEAIGWNDCRKAMLSATDKQESSK
jgi:hypothetical protein